MLQFEELKRELEEQEAALQDLGQALGLEKLREEVEMLEHKSAEPGFWDNMEQAQKITQRMAALKGKDEAYQKLQSRAGDCMALIEMGDEAEDLSLVDEAKEEIEAITGVRPTLVRLPYGDYDDNAVRAVRSIGMEPIQWDVDSLDWKEIPAEEIVQRVTGKVQPGSIVLFHNAALHTPEALPSILETLIQEGYTFVPISQLILDGEYNTDYTIDHTGRQCPA